MFSEDQVRHWLEVAYGDAPGLIHVCATTNWEGWTFEDTEKAVQWIKSLNRSNVEGIYVRATTLTSKPAPGSRGSEGLSRSLIGCWADLDIAGPGHKTSKPLPPTVEEAMRIIAVSGLPEPTMWVHSGGGLYPWWMLRNPIEIDSVEDVKALTVGWQKIIEAASLSLGYSYGAGVGDLARVLRVPGTVNRKAGLERPCRIMLDESPGTMYTFDDLFQAMSDNLPEVPEPAPFKITAPSGSLTNDRPGDDFNNRADWRDLLSGWQWVRKTGDGWELRRPGKQGGSISATLKVRMPSGKEMLKVFTDATEFEQGACVDKFAAYTHMEHNGDFSASARALSRAGYGTRSEIDISDWFVDEGVVESPTAAVEEAVPVQAPKMSKLREWSETGMAHLVVNHVGDNFRAVAEEQGWRVYRSGRWVSDKRSVVHAAVEKVTEIPRQQALDALDAAEANGDKEEIRDAKRLISSVTSFRSARGINAITTRFAQQRGIAVEAGDFDTQRNLICLNNGTFDLDTMKLREHRPTDMLTKKINISYDETATCPGFLKFLEECVPDPEYRDFLRRALGMTLLGRIREAAFLVLHGSTGCGKSQFVKIAQALLGEYAATAASGTFRESKIKGTNDSYDLHDLRGVRMASMSETSEGDVLNEELIKRITGGDTVKTRALYQSHIEWKPDFTVWVATNFRPNLNVSDDAIWRRVKTVEFPNQFKGDKAEIGIAERLIDTELAGIFNWLLGGVRDYVSVGLKEPSTMAESLEAYRDEINPVNQFLTESLAEGVLIAEEGAEVSSSELYGRFASWNESNGVRRFWGQKRFGQEIEKKGYLVRRGTNGVRMRKGLKLREGQWLAGPQRPNWSRS